MLAAVITSGVVTLAILLATGHVAYVVKDKSRRETTLTARKAKYGEQLYQLLGKVYTRKFLIALALISASQVLQTTSKIIKLVQNQDSLIGLVIVGVGLVLAIAGGLLALSSLSGAKKPR